MSGRLPHLTLCLLFAASLATSVTIADQPATSQSATAPDVTTLLARLGSDNFATRQAAQNDLAQFTWKSRSALVKLAEQSQDPEVKTRLLLRVQQIDEELAVDPPPISIHIKAADASTLSATFSREMGMPLVADSDLKDIGFPPRPTATFSLDADDQPFWDIYSKLSQQHFLRIDTPGDPLYSPLIQRVHNYQRFGPFIVYQASAEYFNRVNLQATPGATQPGPQLGAEIVLAADPRIKLAAPVPPFVDSLVDNITLWQRPATAASHPVGILRWAESVPLPSNLKPGQKLFAVGTVHATISLIETRTEIADIATHLQESFPVGPLTCTIGGGTPLRPGDGPSFMIILRNPDADSSHIVTCLVVDSMGRSMQNPGMPSTTSISGGRGVGFAFTGLGKPPYTLTVTTPAKTKDLSFSFRLPLVTE